MRIYAYDNVDGEIMHLAVDPANDKFIRLDPGMCLVIDPELYELMFLAFDKSECGEAEIVPAEVVCMAMGAAMGYGGLNQVNKEFIPQWVKTRLRAEGVETSLYADVYKISKDSYDWKLMVYTESGEVAYEGEFDSKDEAVQSAHDFNSRLRVLGVNSYMNFK